MTGSTKDKTTGWLQLDLQAYRALEAQRVSLEESQLDILKRVLGRHDAPVTADGSGGPDRDTRPARASRLRHAAPPPAGWQDTHGHCDRKTGHFRVQLAGHFQFADSQKAAYRLALIWLDKYKPGTLGRLANEPQRRRRIVAASPQDLYPKSPALVKMAEKLTDDWYVDVNLSKEQKLSRLKSACRVAGLVFGEDLIIDL